MNGLLQEAFVPAELAYRRDRIRTELRWLRLPARRRWSGRGHGFPPVGSQPTRPVLGAPHHATSLG
jgi:hypothetical protein